DVPGAFRGLLRPGRARAKQRVLGIGDLVLVDAERPAETDRRDDHARRALTLSRLAVLRRAVGPLGVLLTALARRARLGAATAAVDVGLVAVLHGVQAARR